VFEKDGHGLHPLEMNQADLLLCSASLRTLLFDDSPSPILLDFLTQHSIKIELETFETDLAMLFFAQVEPKAAGNACDLCLDLLFNQEMRDYCEIGKVKSLVLAAEGTASYADLKKRPEVWRPNNEERERLNTDVGFSNLGGPIQLCKITRKRVLIGDWGNVRLGYLKGIPIRRENIIRYVANKLGGVHYDSKRLPASKEDKSEFKILSQAYDWEKQTIMHAGLAAVAIACIEIATHPQIAEVLRAVKKFNYERQSRLLRGESPVWGSESS
ncbi:MAG TPA: hypothetical protein VJB68_08215, partial [Methylophilaceae bacterium]|nr:hypothetical protein [Methylophilaceae bacterium]